MRTVMQQNSKDRCMEVYSRTMTEALETSWVRWPLRRRTKYATRMRQSKNEKINIIQATSRPYYYVQKAKAFIILKVTIKIC